MTDPHELYDQQYLHGYRSRLVGFEIARWRALDHFITHRVNSNNVRTVLDFGSGSGLHIDLWRKVFPKAELYFCDVSSVALNKLIMQHPEFKDNCEVVTDDGAPFSTDYFDVVVSIEVMEHVENLQAYLRDIFRLLRRDGTFVWTTPCANKWSLEYVFNTLTHQIEPTAEGYRRWRWEHPTHLRRLRSEETKQQLQLAGFERMDYRFRSHLFSPVCRVLFPGVLRGIGEKIMTLDYALFRRLPNGASMIGCARKPV